MKARGWVILLGLGACQVQAEAPAQKATEGVAGQVLARGAWRDFVKTQVIAPVVLEHGLSTTGRVVFDEEQTQRVASPFDGRVAEIMTRPGDRVKPGAPLIAITSSTVADMLGEHKRIKQDMTLAQKALARVRTLAADGAISAKEVAQAEADFEKAQAETDRSAQQLRAFGIEGVRRGSEARAELRARVSGTVVERNVLAGQEVRADGAQPLLTITNLDTVWVMADVYEQDLGQIARGAKIAVTVPAYPGETFAGKLDYIGDVVDPQSRTVKVRCIVPNPSGRLKPEMFAKVDMEQVGHDRVIVVPSKALLNDGEKVAVVLSRDNAFVRRQVEVGSEIRGQRRILSGLQEGDVIVTDGAIFVQNEIN